MSDTGSTGTITLKYADQCHECGQLMRPGDESGWLKAADGRMLHYHPGQCPAVPESAKVQNAVPATTTAFESVWWERKCLGCGERWAGRITARAAIAPGPGKKGSARIPASDPPLECPTCKGTLALDEAG